LSTAARRSFRISSLGRGVEVSGRLVRKHDRRLRDERAADGDTLLLPAGKLGRPVRAPLREAEVSEQLVDPRAVRMHTRDRERQRHVLFGGEHRQEVEELEDEADVLAAQLRQARVVEIGDVDPFDGDRAGGRLVEARQDVHQRRLARAGWAHYGREMSVPHLERDPAQCIDARVARSVAADQVLCGYGNGRRRRCFGHPHGSYLTDRRPGKPKGRRRRKR
jgi:hypothetical protein